MHTHICEGHGIIQILRSRRVDVIAIDTPIEYVCTYVCMCVCVDVCNCVYVCACMCVYCNQHA